MKRNKLILVFVIVAFLGSLVLIFSSGKQAQGKVLVDTSLEALINYQEGLTREGVIDFGAWRVGEKENDRLFYLTKKAPADKENPREGESLRIYDSAHKLIYEERATGFGGIEPFSMLRLSRLQLIIKSINYGGSGRFFKILDFQNGKVISLTNEDDTLYSGEIEILPQYQNDAKYYSAPYQVFLATYFVSPTADATVLRYVKGKYVSVGKLDLTNVGNFIKKNLSK